ncbi:FAD-binding oxidoreductase [Fictibacillus terranigra]|uniref:D-lactate dehydrogenase (cytochrome) n=1 Tax=Fictibacillus terranigra TaxID=3058424 RepID=A0ABT8ECG3_9BACL|nr:FAD-linked oxidase C-terminal domain-containing protein [Fictibacillus sp. CENA-BCM004]MDN4075615.1 FAD-linked oxidase C-terminal domain-containing protein [Fictibacillus sp. CENA-BCM004]
MPVLHENLLMEMKKLTDEKRATSNETVLQQHSKDESHHTPVLPEVVVFPNSASEVSSILQYASNHQIPVVPFGAGSSLEGHCIPLQGGISINFQNMNKILEVREEDFLVRVQPGVTRTQLNQSLKKYGLFFPVDPGADATLGGMAATNASGTTSVRYGIMRPQVRDLEVVLADGSIIRTGGLAAKSSSGYHLTSLFVGSEGTLGVFTELTLKIYGIPEATVAGRAVFPSVKAAVDGAISLLASGNSLARVELVDEHSIRQVNRHSETSYPEKPTLFLEFHGNPAGMKQDVAFAEELLSANGSEDLIFETDSIKKAKLWEARHHLAYAFKHGFPGREMMLTDVCVPLSELTDAVVYARKLIENEGLNGGVLGHVGDGNFHSILMFDKNNEEETEKANRINEKIVEYALSKNGSCTGEHGIGIGKMKYLKKEHADTLPLMKMIKKQFDPRNILNPGKVLF